jgi:hypothetical protein
MPKKRPLKTVSAAVSPEVQDPDRLIATGYKPDGSIYGHNARGVQIIDIPGDNPAAPQVAKILDYYLFKLEELSVWWKAKIARMELENEFLHRYPVQVKWLKSLHYSSVTVKSLEVIDFTHWMESELCPLDRVKFLERHSPAWMFIASRQTDVQRYSKREITKVSLSRLDEYEYSRLKTEVQVSEAEEVAKNSKKT